MNKKLLWMHYTKLYVFIIAIISFPIVRAFRELACGILINEERLLFKI